MRSVLFFIKIILGKNNNLAISKSLIYRLKANPDYTGHPFINFVYKLKLLAYILICPVLLLFRLRYTNEENLVFDISIDPQKRKRRIDYIAHYQGVNKDEIKVVSNNEICFFPSDIFVKIIDYIFLWLIFVYVILRSLFICDIVNISWLNKVFVYNANVIWAKKNDTQLYYFLAYRPEIYVAATTISISYPDVPVYFNLGNTSVSLYNKYTYLKGSTMVLCSRFQQEEVQYFIGKKWIVVKNVELSGLEEIEIYRDLASSDPLYDIGFYSSAEWARDQGLWKGSGISPLNRRKYLNNVNYQSFLNILYHLNMLKREKCLKMKVYMHPYEKYLYKKKKVLPPYLSYLRINNIDFDLYENEQTSINSIYESEIGIASSSTIITDRWHLNLSGLMYYNPISTYERQILNPKYLGEYSQNVFIDMIELKDKIINKLKT